MTRTGTAAGGGETGVYQWGGTAVLRATTYDGGVTLPAGLDLFSEAVAADGLAWLSSVWRDPHLRAVLGETSPVLAERIESLVGPSAQARGVDVRRVRRIVVSVASYLLRWQHRATPFGRFAGVAAARIGTRATVRWGEQHRTALRVDAGWLGEVVDQLHQCGQLRTRLPVVTNDLAVIRGDRVVVPGPPPPDPGELAPVEVTVRATSAVRAALAAASSPSTLGELAALLAERFPTATPDRIDSMLAELLSRGLLISALWAPGTDPNPLVHVRTVLRDVDALAIPAVRSVAAHLEALVAQVARRDCVRADGRAVGPSGCAVDKGPPSVVDTVLDGEFGIPEQVVREARDAVAVLLRASPYPFGYPAWRDYHSRFRARYGSGAVVPVLKLVGDSGLGLPADFLGSARRRPPRQLDERDEKILALVQRSTVEQRGMADTTSAEVVLTDTIVDDLSAGSGRSAAEVSFPPRLEVAVEIQARSTAELQQGRFGLLVTGTPRPGSSMAGRHLHLLADTVREELRRSFDATEPGAVAAQLSFAPRKRRNDNITRTDRLLAHVIRLGEHHPLEDGRIPVADLAVTADAHRFWLVRISTGKRVEPRVPHALEAGVQTPPLARFLAEITTARCAVYKAFHFGAASRLPFLPRVRYRRTVLAPARWLLRPGDLPGRTASSAEWELAWRAWQQRRQIPDHVALVEHDRRLPLDLADRFGRSLLRARLHRKQTSVELRETAAPAELGWIGRAHELLIPLTLDHHATRRVKRTNRLTPERRPGTANPQDSVMPGRSPVLVAQLHTHPDRHDEILTSWVPELLTALGEDVTSWWFHRHRDLRRPDSEQHLALYLRLAGSGPVGGSGVIDRLAAWADDLHRVGLLSDMVLAGYRPQTGRFGSGSAMERAEEAFAVDSAAALAQINFATLTAMPAIALAAASVVDITVGLADTRDAGLAYLIEELPHDRGPLDPTQRATALQLADPSRRWQVVRDLPGGDRLVAAWRARAVAVNAYREALAPQRDPLTVARSLAHLHHVRALPVDPDTERISSRLARVCALRHTRFPSIEAGTDRADRADRAARVGRPAQDF